MLIIGYITFLEEVDYRAPFMQQVSGDVKKALVSIQPRDLHQCSILNYTSLNHACVG
jgi:hypothetical protein